MLMQLVIENIALIESAKVDFDGGFNVFTGETGAGKSILIDALGAVLGLRTSRDLIRTGEKKAFVQGVFVTENPLVTAFLAEQHITVGDEIICSREISADGRNLCRINSVMVSVATLKELGGLLVDLHGQSETQHLADPEKHLAFIDAYGHTEAALADYQAKFTELCRILRAIRALSLSEQEKADKTRRLEEEIALLQAFAPKKGEREELLRRKELAEKQAQTAKAFRKLLAPLEGDEETSGIPEMLQEGLASAKFLAPLYPQLADLPERLNEQAEVLGDLRRTLADALLRLESEEYDPGKIEDRLAEYDRLLRRYGDEEALLEAEEHAAEELDAVSLSADALNEKKAEYKATEPLVTAAAECLTRQRVAAGEALCREIGEELAFLNMPNIRLGVQREAGKLTLHGSEKMELLLSANQGEEMKPLAKIASGGELSRVMLAMKRVLCKNEPEMTQVFDEIDTGISGNAARKVGIRMAEMGKQRQVICVTHLAQIAALADRHMKIEKSSENGRTYTKVSDLSESGRETELARIISGSAPTEAALATAREMRKEKG